MQNRKKGNTRWGAQLCLYLLMGVLAAIQLFIALFIFEKFRTKGGEALFEASTPQPAKSLPAAAEFAWDVGDVTFLSDHEEQKVNVHATVTWPVDCAKPPLVVLCHGFTGNRRGDGHFQPLAQELAQNGIASIAVDFSGNGDSEEPFTAYTIANMKTDVAAAIEYMEKVYHIDPKRIGLVGHSMGGRLVSLCLDDSIAAAALWSPADNAGLDGLEFLDHTPEGREALRATAQQDGSVPLPQWNVTIGSAFIEEMAQSDPWGQIERYRGKLLVAFSAGDQELLSMDTINGTLNAAQAARPDFVNLYGRFENATHNYTALSMDEAENAEICRRIEKATLDFLVDALTTGA